MRLPMAVVLRSLRPRPTSFCSSVGTTLMTHTADFAVRMLPSRLRNWRVPSQLPTTDTITLLIPPTTPTTETVTLLNPPTTPTTETVTLLIPPTTPTAETVTLLIPPTTPRRRQGPRTSSIVGTVTAFVKFLTVTGWVVLSLLLVFVLVYRRAVSFMKWMNEDELDEPGNKELRTKPAEKTNRPKQSGKCVLPAYPENGNYVITGFPDAKPNDSFESLKLTVNCLNGCRVLGSEIVFCLDGLWSDSIPKCVRFCELDNNTSVHYHCLVTGSIDGSRACNRYEPSGTVVRPECKSPNYYSAGALPFMRCIDGSWDYVAVCSPECGRVTPNGEVLMVGGRSAKHGELPWHVGIYLKKTRPYTQICGGTIISNRLVISAAHCFWNDISKQLPASEFAVAAGKIYRPWNNHRDVHAQKFDVKEIKIPARFQGSAANFQDDLAILILAADITYNPFVRPICLSFDFNFDKSQLQPGKLGKVAGWGLTAENGNSSQILKVVDLPYVEIKQCIAASPPNFREHITSDKICAGTGNGKALCRGDSGGGLVFPESERGTDRYYLRGIVSTAATNEHLCNTNTLTTFTQILIHEHFVREYL